MKKNRMLRTIVLSTAFALLAMMLMTPIASAHTATSAQRAVTATSQVPDIPNANIVRSNGRSVFSPSTLHCQAHGPHIPCFTVTNLTSKTQMVLFTESNGKTASRSLLPGGVENFIPVGPEPGVGQFRLQANPQALLTVFSS